MTALPLKYEAASRQLSGGGVIAYPTEGVWGIGCDPLNRKAVMKLLALKRRPWQKGLILIAASQQQIEPYLTGLNANQRRELAATWPGPVTWLVPDNGCAPWWVRGEHSKVALRVSDHPVVASLCHRFGGPIVSTSANVSGRPTARYRWQVLRQLPALDYILPGELGGEGRPTRICDLTTGAVIREG